LEPSIPHDLAQFIQRCIDRLETLDLLLLLQSNAAREWTVRQLSDEMRSSPLATESALAMLLRHGFVAKDGETFRFRPLTPELEETTRRLAACYRERRSAVIAAIFSRPSEAVRSFAEAFRIKKGGSDG
jgi:DNA-binding IclR family transcriptional regulator